MEEWKDVIGYEWFYMVSNLWRVESQPRIVEKKWLYWENKKHLTKRRILKNSVTYDWYLCVDLCKEWKRRIYRVHKLVAQAFIPNPENKPIINHRDGNKKNNWFHEDWKHNLERATYSENTLHAYNVLWIECKLSKSLYWSDNPVSRKIWQYNMNNDIIRIRDCISDAMRETWISVSRICSVCKWRQKSTWWFKRQYI